jgi:hypothetical protein
MNEEPSADILRLRMEQLRSELGQNMEETVENARTLMDWRYHVRMHPWIAVGAAAAAGFLLVPRGNKPCRPDADAMAELARKHHVTLQPERSALVKGGVAAALFSTIAGVVTRGAVNYLSQRVEKWLGTPGSRERRAGSEFY